MRIRILLLVSAFLAPFAVVASGADAPPRGLTAVVEALAKIDDPVAQADVVQGIADALKGRRNVIMPAGWKAVYPKLQNSPNAQVRDSAMSLALIFGDKDAAAAIRQRVIDTHLAPSDRIGAIEALAQAHDSELAPILVQHLDDPAIRSSALKTLASYNESSTPQAIVSRYSSFNPEQRNEAINTLASRPAWAAAMLDAVDAGKIPRADVSTVIVRQLVNLHDTSVSERVKKLYGNVRPPAKDKAGLIAKYKKIFKPDLLAQADLPHGRELFTKTCAACHTLFDTGGHVGPELTGSQRANLDYILENVVDPSAVVAKDYYMTIIETNGGQTITGIVKSENDKSLTVRDTTQDWVLAKSDIKSRRTSPVSMMPEGLLEALSTADARDLIAYLASPVQVPLKK